MDCIDKEQPKTAAWGDTGRLGLNLKTVFFVFFSGLGWLKRRGYKSADRDSAKGFHTELQLAIILLMYLMEGCLSEMVAS